MDVVECTKYLPAVRLMFIEVGDQNQMLGILVKMKTNVYATVGPSEVRIYLFLVVDN
jgi:hypothetical protein